MTSRGLWVQKCNDICKQRNISWPGLTVKIIIIILNDNFKRGKKEISN